MAKGLFRSVAETTTGMAEGEGGHLSIALIDVTPTLSKEASPEAMLAKLAGIVKSGLRGQMFFFITNMAN